MGQLSEYVFSLLSAYAISYILVYKDGPWDIFDRLRAKLGIYGVENYKGDIVFTAENQLGRVFTCQQCLGFWCLILTSFLYVNLEISRGFLQFLAIYGILLYLTKE